MSKPVNLRKRELECMRLAADCMQLASQLRSPVLQSHFVRMACKWSTVAAEEPEYRYSENLANGS